MNLIENKTQSNRHIPNDVQHIKFSNYLQIKFHTRHDWENTFLDTYIYLFRIVHKFFGINFYFYFSFGKSKCLSAHPQQTVG